MDIYYKLPIKELLQYFDPYNTSFMHNQQIISMKYLETQMNNDAIFYDDEASLEQQKLYDKETLHWLKKIISEVSNPQFLHDGNIKIVISGPHLTIDSVVYGMEKIMSAIYHNEKYIIVQMDGNIELLFSDITGYDSLQSIDYSFTKFIADPLLKEQALIINYSDTLDLEYAGIILNEELITDWNNKEEIIKKIQNGEIDIAQFIPEHIFNDDDFIVSLFFINYAVGKWFDNCSPRWFTLLEKIHDTNTESSYQLLSKILSECWSYYYFDEYNDNVEIYFLGNKKLVAFILKSEEFARKYSYPLTTIVDLLPSEILNDAEILVLCIPYLTVDTLKNIDAQYFNNPTFISEYVNCIDDHSKIDDIKEFFTINSYTHAWCNNKQIVLEILNSIKIKNYHQKDIIIFIYTLLSENLKNDNDVIIKSLYLNNDIINIITREKCYEPEIMNYYLKNGNLSFLSYSYYSKKNNFCYTYKDLFEQRDEDIIEHICTQMPDILFHANTPLTWKNNLHLATINKYFFTNNFNNYEICIQNAILNDRKTLTELLNEHPHLYPNLPLDFQCDEELALIYEKEGYRMQKFPIKLLLNMNFCCKLVDMNIHNISDIPEVIKNNVYFILYYFKLLSQCAAHKIENIKKSYSDLFKIIDHFNIQPIGYHDFLMDYFKKQNNYKLYQDLKTNLPTTNTSKGKAKI